MSLVDPPASGTFAAFVSSLSLKGADDDPDLDGLGNLLEYAFGGDPAERSATAAGGYPIAPVIFSENGTVSYAITRRTDAVARGLTYQIEFSETLGGDSWSSDLPPGASMNVEAFNPDVPGFERATVSFPADGVDKLFMRAKITLDE